MELLDFGILEKLTTSQSSPQRRRNAAIAVAAATLIQVAGQLLLKRGAAQLGDEPTVLQAAIGMFTIAPLFFGFALYGIFTVIMVFALRRAELSLLYPIMALSYVWVTLVSIWWLKEPVHGAGLLGVAVIVMGVAVLGKGETKQA